MWKLHPHMFQILQKVWRLHTINRFASETTAQLPHHNTLFHNTRMTGVDTLAQEDWGR